MYLLESGQVQLSSDHGAIFDTLYPGCFFGEKFLLPAPAAGQVAKCITPVKVSTFGTSQLLREMKNDSRFAMGLIRDLALRIDRYEQTIRDFVSAPAELRLARLLLRLAPARPATGWVRLPVSPSNPELARMVGTTRERISHFVNRFQQQGWIRRQEGLWIHREMLSDFIENSRRS